MSYLVVKAARPAPASVPAPAPPKVVDTSQAQAAELAKLRAQAEAEGRAKGEAQGQAELRLQAAALELAADGLRAAWAQLAAPLADKENDLADLVLDLAFELARHVIGQEINADPLSLKALVTRLIQEAATERGPKQSIVVRMNPADHALIERMMIADNAHLLADAAISRGGALVEVIAPNGDPLDKTEWDATIEGRIAAMRTALGLRGDAPDGAA